MNINFAARQLVRSCSKGFLSTDFDPGNFSSKKTSIKNVFPYSTFTLTAFDYDLSPILLLSDLSEHTQNLKFKKLCSLMICEEQKMYEFFPKFLYNKKLSYEYEDPMSRPRITLIGELSVTNNKRHLERFLARHPTSTFYSSFSDMNFYIMKIKSAHLVGGFAQVKWFDANEIICKNFSNFFSHEKSIIKHMNECHIESVNSYATNLIPNMKGSKNGWKLIGIDPDGFDLRKKDRIARFCFKEKVNNAKKLRGIFVHLHKLASST
ncbi:MAG: hypothetical protein CFH30_00233 [Alphaproteobacteria bacterium MarineAlpha8_Bin1]|nr:MAG: hypothetical protein CFH30_00233 [Alphaproteobacteria bacterium MarineAlpha8_Bin1]|tara:strand:- start:5 stop:799 length:795 start_codon:yes stop_codon:yes gene_type:complete